MEHVVIMFVIPVKKTSKEMWEAIHAIHIGSGHARKSPLQ